MALSVKHTTQSAVVDEGVTGEIGPSEWNDEHALTVGAASLLGATAGGPVAELTASQAKALLAVAIADVDGLQTALDAKADLPGNDTFTKVLLQFPGSDGSTTIIDGNAGGSAHTWTANGNAQIDTAASKFGGSALLCDGTGDYVTTPDHADFTRGSGPWTDDVWFNCTGAGGTSLRISGQANSALDSTSRAASISRSSANVIQAVANVGATPFVINGTTQFTDVLNTGWHHVAFVSTGTILRLFIDGVQEGGDTAITGTINDSSNAFSVGALGENTTNTWQGWIDEYRLSIGVARWTANFTPPAVPYSPAVLTASSIAFTPAGGIAATDVQAAVEEARSDAATLATAAGAAAQAASAPVGEAFLTVGATANLTSERAIAVGQGLVATDGGAGGAYTIRRGSENTATIGLDWPVSNDAAIRLAAGIDGLSYGVVYHGGNGLWLYDTFSSTFRPGRIRGDFEIVDLTNCTIDGVAGQARVAGTHYYIYAYFSAAGAMNAAYELSTTAPTTGDPLGATTVTGWHMKNDGTRNKRLVGTAKSDAAGVFWRAGARGVYMSGIASYYEPQHLNYHLHVSGGNAATAYTEINSNQYLSAMMWDDGREPFINLSGSVQSNSAGANVSVGVSIDGESPPYDFVDVDCPSANQPVPFSVTVTGGDFDTNLHTYRVLMKNTTGSGTINVGANFAMKLEQ